MNQNEVTLTDLSKYFVETLPNAEFAMIDASRSIPGKGYSYLFVNTSNENHFPLSFHCIKYVYECTPDHENSFRIYNDPDGMNRWTVIPYTSEWNGSVPEDLNAFHMIPDKVLYLGDDELELLIYLSSAIQETLQPEFIGNPIAVWNSLKNLTYSIIKEVNDR